MQMYIINGKLPSFYSIKKYKNAFRTENFPYICNGGKPSLRKQQ